MEIIVLLNDAATCTIPAGTFFFSFLRKTFFLPPVLAITLNRSQPFLFLARRFLLGNRRLAWALSSARVGMSSLTTHRQRSTMSQAAIAADVHQPLDIHLDTFPQITFDVALSFEHATNSPEFVLIQISNARIDVYVRFLENGSVTRSANAVNVI